MTTLIDLYPPFGVRITCGELELRVLRDEDFPALEQLAARGVASEETPRPFLMQWHLQPRSTGAQESARFYWAQRAQASPKRWEVKFGVFRGGVLVGSQDVGGADFPSLRVLTTGSWVGRPFHGQGIGTLMRQMVCAWGFDELGAREMRSAAYEDNQASLAVSAKLGYRENGYQWVNDEGTPRREVAFVLTREHFRRPPEPVRFEGTDGFRRFIGLDDGDAQPV